MRLVKSDEWIAPIRVRTPLMGEGEMATLGLVSRLCVGLKGTVAELGVYRGASTYILSHALPSKTIHVFDTFAGFPKETVKVEEQHFADGLPTFDRDETLTFLKNLPNVVVYPGVFPGTARSLLDKKFCFAHFDADLYMPTKAFIDFFWPRLVFGGVLLFHDFGWSNTPGVEQALRETELDVISLGNGQVMAQKRS